MGGGDGGADVDGDVTGEVDGDDNILVDYEVCVCVLVMRRERCLDG